MTCANCCAHLISALWRLPLAVARLSTVCAAAMVVLACGALPDAGKLTDASIQLRSAVVATGSAVETELKVANRGDTAGEFAKAWRTVDQSCTALVGYAEALGGIVQAGKDSADAARKLGDAGQNLAMGLGLTTTPVVKELIPLAASVYGQIAQARAARSLEESLVRMQPAVDEMAGLVASQLSLAQDILVAANLRNGLLARTAYQKDEGYMRTLQSQREVLYQKGALTASTGQQLEQIDRAERIVRTRLDSRDQLLAAGEQRLRQNTQLIDSAKRAVLDWADAHRQLQVAVRDSRSVDPKALAASIEELRTLVIKVREAS